MKILFLINHAAFFSSHRIDLYISAKKFLKAKCLLVIGQGASKIMEKKAISILKKKKINYKVTKLTSSKNKIVSDIYGLIQSFQICNKFKPDILHSATPKFNFIGVILALALNIRTYVCSVSGMGYLYTNKKISFFEKILKYVNILFFILLKIKSNKKIILQNLSDYKFFSKIYSKNCCFLVPSSGIKIENYKFKINKKKIVVLPSRLLKDKGVIEFVRSAKNLKQKYPRWSFKLIGARDYDNPSLIDTKIFEEEINNGDIEIQDYNNSLSQVYKDASIVCLPSHREGFSKVILEAGILKLPIVASNIPGNKQGIINNKTGILFKSKNIKDLTNKLEYLIKNKKKEMN